MRGRRVILAGAVATVVGLVVAWPAAAQREQGWAVRESLTNPDVPLYNTAKQKLLDGEQVFTYTIASRDPEFYCEVAPHYDFIFFEMQHSTMSWADVEAMIAACPGVGVPMVRLPDVLEGSIQKATDIGALGVIGPTINTIEQATALAQFAKFPPDGRRSAGRNQAARIWGWRRRQLPTDHQRQHAGGRPDRDACRGGKRLPHRESVGDRRALGVERRPGELHRAVADLAGVARDVRQSQRSGAEGR